MISGPDEGGGMLPLRTLGECLAGKVQPNREKRERFGMMGAIDEILALAQLEGRSYSFVWNKP